MASQSVQSVAIVYHGLIRGGLMISLNFSIDINPQVFYIFVGLFVVYEIAQIVWLLKLKNKIKLEMFKND